MTPDQFKVLATKNGVPGHLIGGMSRYVFNRIRPGSFLSAILSNDIFEAIACADALSLVHLPQILIFIAKHFPSESYGSIQKTSSWIRQE